MERITEILKRRILILDGAMGTMIQNYRFNESDFRGREFINHSVALTGFNDILNISKPSAIEEIHRSYLEAGANIISTNTFNSNAVSIKDYGFKNNSGIVSRLNREGAFIARKAVDRYLAGNPESICYVGGSVGPTNRSASMSPDISDPLLRNISYDELIEAYFEQIMALIQGGIDLLICETFFDTLNLKAALNAADKAMATCGKEIPVMVSATVSDNTGRILSGQTLEAFVTSVCEFKNVDVIGLNCGFGPDQMIGHLENLNSVNPHFTSCHPNAGLPDESGCYDISPEKFADYIKEILNRKLTNIIGGCCGTTPVYIRQLSEVIKEYEGKALTPPKPVLALAGLDRIEVKKEFLVVGERCNVAGSAKFLRLIKENNLEEAAEIAKNQIRKGASIIDINLDDPLLDAEKAMVVFLRYILAEPEIAKVPFMIDTSKWEVMEIAMKNLQGKGIMNSISLKEGEDQFLYKAKKIKEYGHAVVVMAFDERGQADTYERKVEISLRSYNLLVNQVGFNPEDIIFDVNIMTIATGMKEHSKYAMDYIRAVEWIKNNLKGARTSGGVSNLSFAFRGKNRLREKMHSVFLYHAIKAGLDMAIINPSSSLKYTDIPSEERIIIEDVIFDRGEAALERLVELAEKEEKPVKKDIPEESPKKIESVEEKLINDLITGETLKLEEHLEEALKNYSDPIQIIEGPLLSGMKIVGDKFGEGKMFLPQVVKTARTMKKAVDLLTPKIESGRKGNNDKKAGKILIATVKGDVHDIGKNIVSTVLSCNNYEVVDLGIMVSPETIVEKAKELKPDIICLSGLITPSLAEMAETVTQLKEAGIETPVMVGGAATSEMHTALKIQPEYSGLVLHMPDASKNPASAARLLNPVTVNDYIGEIKERYNQIVNEKKKDVKLLPFREVMTIVENRYEVIEPSQKPSYDLGKPLTLDLDLDEIIPFINWKMFLSAWKIRGTEIESLIKDFKEKTMEDIEIAISDDPKLREASELLNTAFEILKELKIKGNFNGKARVIFERCHSLENEIRIGEKSFPMLRQQRNDSDFLSCSDFVNRENDHIGLFAVTSGTAMADLSKKFEKENDTYKSLVVQTLADRLAEAASEWLQKFVSDNYWKVNIRPAWGYPMLPDQTLILETDSFLNFSEIGISLTENGAMYPPASVSGLYLSDPKSKYFMVGKLGEDQMIRYAGKRGLPLKRVEDILRNI